MRTIGSKVAPHFPPASGPSGVAPAPGSGSTENLDPGIWKLRGPPFGRTLRSSSPAATGRFLHVALPRARSSAAGSLQQFAKFLPGGGPIFWGSPSHRFQDQNGHPWLGWELGVPLVFQQVDQLQCGGVGRAAWISQLGTWAPVPVTSSLPRGFRASNCRWAADRLWQLKKDEYREPQPL